MRTFLEALNEEGLNATSALVLDASTESPGVAMSIIAERAGVSSAAMTGTVDKLEKAQLVRRERPLTDRRSIHVIATKEGLAKISLLRAAWEKANREQDA